MPMRVIHHSAEYAVSHVTSAGTWLATSLGITGTGGLVAWVATDSVTQSAGAIITAVGFSCVGVWAFYKSAQRDATKKAGQDAINLQRQHDEINEKSLSYEIVILKEQLRRSEVECITIKAVHVKDDGMFINQAELIRLMREQITERDKRDRDHADRNAKQTEALQAILSGDEIPVMLDIKITP